MRVQHNHGGSRSCQLVQLRCIISAAAGYNGLQHGEAGSSHHGNEL